MVIIETLLQVQTSHVETIVGSPYEVLRWTDGLARGRVIDVAAVQGRPIACSSQGLDPAKDWHDHDALSETRGHVHVSLDLFAKAPSTQASAACWL